MALELKSPDGMVRVQKTVTINQSPETLYRTWRDLERLPEFMEHVESVVVLDNGRSHWIVKAPAGRSVEWDAEITEDRENEYISWRSLPDAEIENSGEIRFTPVSNGHGTEVRVTLVYDPPAGTAGTTIAKLFGEEPARQLDDDLYRFKQLMETGRIPTTSGQPHGER